MATFSFFREATVDAPPARVHALIDNLHNWQQWSPWEGLDPELQRTYSGPEHGVGATYAWSGNRKAGVGEMEITGSTPERIDIALRFMKPFKANNDVRFDLFPMTGGRVADSPATDDPATARVSTVVRWTMSGTNSGIWAVLSKLVPTEKMVAKDFEKGLAQLQGVAAQAAGE